MSTHSHTSNPTGRRAARKNNQRRDRFNQPIPALKSGPYGDCYWSSELGQYIKPTARQVRLNSTYAAQRMNDTELPAAA